MTNTLPENFIIRMKEQLGEDLDSFLRSYEMPAVRGLRVNTLKVSPDEFVKISGLDLAPSEVLEEGFVLKSDLKVKDDPYHFAGLYYMQEPSAMSPIAAAKIEKGMKVLDLCAAPGGKSGGVAARLQGEGLLVSNEIVPNRAKILAGNLERLGVTNAVVTSAHPDKICNALYGFFDVVFVDAPCSGEGMFRRDEIAVKEWSKEHVLACANRQHEILESAQYAVKDGGALVYSTCTFSTEENEETVEWFLNKYTDFELEFMHRIYPHKFNGEGHFVARLVKKGERLVSKFETMDIKRCKEKEFLKFINETYAQAPNAEAFMLKDGRIILTSTPFPKELSNLKIISAGVLAGEMLSNRFVPAHNLFMAAFKDVAFKNSFALEYKDERIVKFLKGETLECEDSIKGYLPISVNGFNIGFGKASGGTLKNHIPKGLRLF